MCVCMLSYVHMGTEKHIHVQRPEKHIGFFLYWFLHCFFETRSVTEPEACHFCEAGWPVSIWDPSVSISQSWTYKHM